MGIPNDYGTKKVTTEKNHPGRQNWLVGQRIISSPSFMWTHRDKKKTSSNRSDCVPRCLRAEEKNEEFKKLKKPSIFSISENNIIDDEIKIERSRAAIASNFGVPIDAVDVSVEDLSGQLIIMGATIYLSSEDVDKINRLR